MTCRVALVCAVLAAPAVAQPLAPQPTDYPAHAKAQGFELAARFLPHGLPPGAAISAGKDFLVVEVGVFPESKSPFIVSRNRFTLNVDGKELAAVRPAADAVPPGDASARNSNLQLGGAPQFERSRNTPESGSIPRRPVSVRPDSSTSPEQPKTELPEGAIVKPVSGYLFFRFAGDANAIRSVELVYSGSGAKLKVRIL